MRAVVRRAFLARQAEAELREATKTEVNICMAAADSSRRLSEPRTSLKLKYAAAQRNLRPADSCIISTAFLA